MLKEALNPDTGPSSLTELFFYDMDKEKTFWRKLFRLTTGCDIGESLQVLLAKFAANGLGGVGKVYNFFTEP